MFCFLVVKEVFAQFVCLLTKIKSKSEKGQANSEWRHLAIKSASPGDQNVTLDLVMHDNY